MRCIKFAHIDQLNGLGSNQVCWYIDGQRLFVSALNALVVSTRTEQCLNIRFNYAYGFVRSDRHFALSAKISWMVNGNWSETRTNRRRTVTAASTNGIKVPTRKNNWVSCDSTCNRSRSSLFALQSDATALRQSLHPTSPKNYRWLTLQREQLVAGRHWFWFGFCRGARITTIVFHLVS